MINEELQPVYCITITYRDEANNKLVRLGGAGWATQEEWDEQWNNNIPAASNDSIRCIADKIDADDVIVDDRFVDRETVETLLGKPMRELIEEGRKQQEMRRQ